MEPVFKTDYCQAAKLIGIDECPDTISIEELKKWVTRLGEFGHDFVIISSVPEVNDKRMVYAIVYAKKLCAYWIIPNDDESVNTVFNSLKNGEPLPEAVEQVL